MKKLAWALLSAGLFAACGLAAERKPAAVTAALPAAQSAPGTSATTEIPLEVSGDAMPSDSAGEVVEVRGNVRVTRGAFTMTSDYLKYEKKKDTALATGEVHASDGQFNLSCRRLIYHIGPQLAVAWDDPVALRTSPLPKGAGEEIVELRATQITIWIDDSRMEGTDKVELTRWTEKDGHRELDVKLRSRDVEIDQVARTSQFRGGVEIESPEVHAVARQALLEEPLDRLTLVGDAEAWTPGPDGEKLDCVRGAKIIYFLHQKRTIVFGGVDGRMRIGK